MIHLRRRHAESVVRQALRESRVVVRAAFRSLAGMRDQMDRAGGSSMRGVVLYWVRKRCLPETGWLVCRFRTSGDRPRAKHQLADRCRFCLKGHQT